MKRSKRRTVAWIVGLALAFSPLYCLPKETPPREPSFALRLLGPIASWAASAQWVRVDAAIRAGRTDLALGRAETALAIDPTATEGWIYLGRHLAFDLASVEREPDVQRRLGWVRASLAVLERGEKTAGDPAELVFWQGLVLARTAAVDETLPWPGGLRGLWTDASTRFERAERLGHPLAGELARRALDEAEHAAR